MPATSFSTNEGEYQPKSIQPNKLATHEIEKSQCHSLPSSRSATPDQSCISDDEDDDADDRSDRLNEGGVEESYRAIYQSFCGIPLDGEERLTFYLEGQRSYKALLQKLDNHAGLLSYFTNEIRKDWNASTGELVILRLTATHQIFLGDFAAAITPRLDKLAQDVPGLAPIRDKIYAGYRTSIEYTKRWEKSPDHQLFYGTSAYPPFVVEAAYSEDWESLNDKVDEYFTTLGGGIRTVLGFDIGYKKPKDGQNRHHTASVSLWSASIEDDYLTIDRKMNKVVFRTEEGITIPGALVLPLELFLPLEDRDKIPAHVQDRAVIQFDFAFLAQLLSKAESRQQIIDSHRSPPPIALKV
ncbi:hypothetical protein ONZ43_g5325 [Nemania bipapillata]|uniref:Uncharacterized protein n=1 Tax=Nemania bipapillata TaxID=110536 RepID=A0ACC2IC61_9PEZI|nr:hypothetical protein ONZ43_g5325 [Nemania bipapillata]